jgi:hypothetical protein
VFFRKKRRAAADEARTLLGEHAIVALDDFANFFGLESAGMAQIRGNGCLAASHDEVLFLMWIPRREIRIPRERITSVERTRSHLRKTIGRQLLRLRFTNDLGQPDSAAWFVRDLPTWEAVLAS